MVWDPAVTNFYDFIGAQFTLAGKRRVLTGNGIRAESVMVSNLPTAAADKKAQIDHAVPFLLQQCCLYTNRRAALDASNAANQQTRAPSGITAVVILF